MIIFLILIELIFYLIYLKLKFRYVKVFPPRLLMILSQPNMFGFVNLFVLIKIILIKLFIFKLLFTKM